MKVAKICVATIGGAFFVRSNWGALFILEEKMNYNYNQNYKYNQNRSIAKTRIIIVMVLIALSAIIALCNGLSTLFTKTNYFNESFEYDDLEITVTDVTEVDQENGSFVATITFFAKNIGEKTNSFDLDDVYLKSETTKKEYNRAELFSHENIKAGESKEYKIEFSIPSSISSEKYILYFDFNSDHHAKCALYYENGEMLKIEPIKLYHDSNIQALSSHFETELAEEILLGLEKTNVLKENTHLNSDWIVKRDISTFELYNDFSIIISVHNNQFKIFAYETVYDDATAILLYDSANPAEMKTLSETEREDLRSAQRKYQVQSTIDISPSFGALLHDQWGNTCFSFSVKNKSNSSFVYIDITFMPSFPGYEGELRKKTYTSWEEIQTRKSKEFTLKTTGWENYDFFEVTNIVIMFDDGTSIQFDEYDCQFLKD